MGLPEMRLVSHGIGIDLRISTEPKLPDFATGSDLQADLRTAGNHVACLVVW